MTEDYRISETMRDYLIEHLDGAYVPFILPSSVEDSLLASKTAWRIQTAHALINRGLIIFGKDRKYTVITKHGRRVLAKLLGEYADTLVRVQQKTLDKKWLASIVGFDLVSGTRDPELV